MKEEARKRWNAYSNKYSRNNYVRYTVLLRKGENDECIECVNKNGGSKFIKKILLANYKK